MFAFHFIITVDQCTAQNLKMIKISLCFLRQENVWHCSSYVTENCFDLFYWGKLKRKYFQVSRHILRTRSYIDLFLQKYHIKHSVRTPWLVWNLKGLNSELDEDIMGPPIFPPLVLENCVNLWNSPWKPYCFWCMILGGLWREISQGLLSTMSSQIRKQIPDFCKFLSIYQLIIHTVTEEIPRKMASLYSR